MMDEPRDPGRQDPPRPLEVMNAHLWFLEERNVPGCFVCRRPFRGREASPHCERCGIRTCHDRCYVEAVARDPRERVAFTAPDDSVHAPHVIFLCPGCRS